MLTKSSCKLEPTSTDIDAAALGVMLHSRGIQVSYVDDDYDHSLKNDHSTVVLILEIADPHYWGELIQKLRPDEYTVRSMQGKKVIRLWWD